MIIFGARHETRYSKWANSKNVKCRIHIKVRIVFTVAAFLLTCCRRRFAELRLNKLRDERPKSCGDKRGTAESTGV